MELEEELHKYPKSKLLIQQSLYSSAGVVQVNIPAATGDMGVLANHVASIEPLRPGVVEVIEENGQQAKKWFGMSSPSSDVAKGIWKGWC